MILNNRRKIRCQGDSPCNFCARNDITCVYSITKQSATKKAKVDKRELVIKKLNVYNIYNNSSLLGFIAFSRVIRLFGTIFEIC